TGPYRRESEQGYQGGRRGHREGRQGADRLDQGELPPARLDDGQPPGPPAVEVGADQWLGGGVERGRYREPARRRGRHARCRQGLGVLGVLRLGHAAPEVGGRPYTLAGSAPSRCPLTGPWSRHEGRSLPGTPGRAFQVVPGGRDPADGVDEL